MSLHALVPKSPSRDLHPGLCPGKSICLHRCRRGRPRRHGLRHRDGESQLDPTGRPNPQQIYNNANAPFINSIVNSGFNGGALNPQATLYGAASPISINSQVSYATAYHNVLAGTAANIHPSEPNYIWSEAGTNFGILNDNTPYTSSRHQSKRSDND